MGDEEKRNEYDKELSNKQTGNQESSENMFNFDIKTDFNQHDQDYAEFYSKIFGLENEMEIVAKKIDNTFKENKFILLIYWL